MKPENFLSKELQERLKGHLPQTIIDQQCIYLVQYYKKYGMTRTISGRKQNIVDVFFDNTKKAHKDSWK